MKEFKEESEVVENPWVRITIIGILISFVTMEIVDFSDLKGSFVTLVTVAFIGGMFMIFALAVTLSSSLLNTPRRKRIFLFLESSVACFFLNIALFLFISHGAVESFIIAAANGPVIMALVLLWEHKEKKIDVEIEEMVLATRDWTENISNEEEE